LPELIWDGKYGADGSRTASPAPVPHPQFRVAESYPAAPAAGDASQWRNRLVLGENRLALHALLDEFRGQVQLVYIDPPFEVGSDFQLSLRAQGTAGGGRKGLAYRDKWGAGTRSYLHMMHERLVLLRQLLRESGCLFLHCDWRNSASLRLMLDEVFGRERFVNEIVWHYYNKYSGGKACLPRAHDTILLYGKSARFAVNPLRLPRPAPQRQLLRKAVNGVLKNAKGPDGHVLYRIVTDKKADDVWDLPQLQPASPQWTGYGTQKHHDLLARIVALGSRPGDLVLDAFCGSGTTVTVAQALGRRWIGCDLGRPAVHITRRRLWALGSVGTPDGFDVCDLGSAERSTFIQSFPNRDAFTATLLKQLGAKPAGPSQRCDGTLGRTRVIVGRGAEDAALEEIEKDARNAKATRRQPLVYAAWGFEPGLWDRLEGSTLAGAVKPLLLPREWLGPNDATDAPCTLLPRISVARSVSQAADAGVTFTLTGWAVPALGGRQAAQGAGSPVGLGDVDAWAIQSGWRPGQPFSPQAIAFRGKRQPLAAHLTVPWSAHGAVLVKAWDGFGREGSAVLALPERVNGSGKRRKSRS
jgi:DNA modification methylase